FTGTGSGKASLFTVPLVVHRELSNNPDHYPALPVQENAVAMVITPTKGLANSIIHELEHFGLRGLSYCRETISEYRTIKKLDLVHLICECKSWDLICMDPEHLATPEWREIIWNNKFKRHLILFAVDEAHLIRRWSPTFRPAFDDIGALARGYLPEEVSMVGLSATYMPFTRPLLEYLRSGRKTVIHVETIPIAYEIYEFLWEYLPPGHSPLHRMRMYHALCTDEYNRETFRLVDSDSELQVVIATVGFSQGINCRGLLDSISWGFPST
ncbi:hypothetical protein K435DRAFT_622475, partial [Dendrothele bispora CBS 962.96]